MPTPAVQWGQAGPRQNYARACAAAAIFPGFESGVVRGACSLGWVWRPLCCDRPSRRGHRGVSTPPRIFIAKDLLSPLRPHGAAGDGYLGFGWATRGPTSHQKEPPFQTRPDIASLDRTPGVAPAMDNSEATAWL